MKRHDWPGNIRELENMVRRLAALHPDDVIGHRRDRERTHRRAPYRAARGSRRGFVEAVPSGETLEAFFRGYLKTYFGRFGDELPPAGLYDRLLVEFERPLVAAALAATNGNQVRAADLLGLNRNTLRKKIRELGIRMTSAVG